MGAAPEMPVVELRTYLVEDNATIRENLIGTLEELASARDRSERIALPLPLLPGS